MNKALIKEEVITYRCPHCLEAITIPADIAIKIAAKSMHQFKKTFKAGPGRGKKGPMNNDKH